MKSSRVVPEMRWWAAIFPFAFLIATMFFVVRFFGVDALSGASQVALLLATAVAAGISMLFYKVPWKTIEKAIVDNISSIATAILILFLIGAISGSWMTSGVVPTMIYYGLKVIHPSIFLFATCIICALVSIMTGSSWTTIATIGVALIGIGNALGFSAGWTAGAIISGAYFGDKVSPLSDTTVLASSSAGTPLFTHIRYMMLTTVPSFVLACVVFLVASILHAPAAPGSEAEISGALKASFNLSPWLLIVPLLTGVLIVRKTPALLTLTAAAVMAGVAALLAQPGIVAEIGGSQTLDFRSAFQGIFISYFGSTAIRTGSEILDPLVSTSGMTGMLQTVFLIVCATTFGGAMVGSGMIRSLTEFLTKRISSSTWAVGATVGTGIFSNLVVGDQYLSIILTCSLYRKLFKDNGLEERLLSRSVEDSATVTSVLIPWNSCGMTQATVLKVPTMTYLPYCFFNLLSPVMSILIAATGYKIVKKSLELKNN